MAEDFFIARFIPLHDSLSLLSISLPHFLSLSLSMAIREGVAQKWMAGCLSEIPRGNPLSLCVSLFSCVSLRLIEGDLSLLHPSLSLSLNPLRHGEAAKERKGERRKVVRPPGREDMDDRRKRETNNKRESGRETMKETRNTKE